MSTLLQVNTVINSGSTGRIAEEIGILATSKGWASFIAYGRNDRPSNSNKIRIGTDWDVRFHGIKTRLFDKHGFGSYKATKSFINKVEQLNPNIIHLHNIHGYYLNIKVLFEYLNYKQIPIVWTLHDCWPMTGHCAHFDYIGCNKWKTECHNCPQIKSYPASLIDCSKENFHLKKAIFNSVKNMTIVTVSNWLGEKVNQSYISNYPLKIINNGIDLSIFNPKKNATALRTKYRVGSKFMILGVANIWSKEKGLDDFNKLSELLPEDSVILIVGVTPQQVKKLNPKIIGIKRTESTTELAELYSAADVYLNTTYQDSFPTTNLEALGCGTPVITYRTGGSVESISEDTGFITDKGNIVQVLEVLEIIKKSGKLTYSQACTNRAHNLYDKSIRYIDYLNLYSSLLKE